MGFHKGKTGSGFEYGFHGKTTDLDSDGPVEFVSNKLNAVNNMTTGFKPSRDEFTFDETPGFFGGSRDNYFKDRLHQLAQPPATDSNLLEIRLADRITRLERDLRTALASQGSDLRDADSAITRELSNTRDALKAADQESADRIGRLERDMEEPVTTPQEQPKEIPDKPDLQPGAKAWDTLTESGPFVLIQPYTHPRGASMPAHVQGQPVNCYETVEVEDAWIVRDKKGVLRVLPAAQLTTTRPTAKLRWVKDALTMQLTTERLFAVVLFIAMLALASSAVALMSVAGAK